MKAKFSQNNLKSFAFNKYSCCYHGTLIPVRNYCQGQVRTYAEKTETSVDVDQIVKELSDRLDKVEDKTSFVLYGGGGVLLIWIAFAIVGAVNNIPLLPKLMELVGLSYTAWFTYRYLLFKSSRQELVQDIEELKKRMSGDQ